MSGLSIMSHEPITIAMDEPPTLVRGFCLRSGYSVVSPRGLSGIWRLGDAAVVKLVCGFSPELDCVSSPAQSVLVRSEHPSLFLRHDKTSTLRSVRT